MAASLKIILWALGLCFVVAIWPCPSWGHRKAQASSPRQASPPPPSASAAAREAPGVAGRTFDELLRFANLHPLHPERAAALLQAARLARQDGEIDQAVKVYTLVAALYPNTHTSTQAQAAALTLKFYQELANGEPLPAFRRFLVEVASLSPPPVGPLLAEPLDEGWSAVTTVVRSHRSLPPPVLEEVLALWELHPQELRPPWAGLLLARLLKEKGMAVEAAALLSRICEQGPAWVRTEALVDLLELAWGARGLPGVLDALQQLPLEEQHLAPGLNLWLARFLPGDAVPEGGADTLKSWRKEILGWVAQESPRHASPSLPVSVLEGLLGHAWPRPVQEWLLLEVAKFHWNRQNLVRAAQVYQDLLALQPSPEVEAFCRDRLAISRLQEGRPDAAREIYQELGQVPEPLWRLWAQTRLMDLELARLKTVFTP